MLNIPSIRSKCLSLLCSPMWPQTCSVARMTLNFGPSSLHFPSASITRTCQDTRFLSCWALIRGFTHASKHSVIWFNHVPQRFTVVDRETLPPGQCHWEAEPSGAGARWEVLRSLWLSPQNIRCPWPPWGQFPGCRIWPLPSQQAGGFVVVVVLLNCQSTPGFHPSEANLFSTHSFSLKARKEFLTVCRKNDYHGCPLVHIAPSRAHSLGV